MDPSVWGALKIQPSLFGTVIAEHSEESIVELVI